MRRLEESREIYENITVPEELDKKVRDTIREAREKRAGMKKGEKIVPLKPRTVRPRGQKVFRWAAGMAAAFAAAFIVGLNTSEAFAMGAQGLPVIGELAKILTVRSYEREEENIQIDVEVPGVELADRGLSQEVNTQIEKMVRQYEEEALGRAKEYKKAFLETGGTEEEWAAHKIRIHVWYEIKCQTEDTLSFVVRGTENWSSAYAEARYYNLDLERMDYLSLSDLLGQDYIARANESIRSQIEKRIQAGETFFTAEEGGFETITEDAAFYINEKGNPVIVFEKYAIAPGAMGEPEFVIGEEDLGGNSVSSEEELSRDGEVQDERLDNFDVDGKEILAFAEAVKEAVAAKDLEKLADLTGFPVYVGLDGVGVVETREDFLALDPELVFSKEMTASIEKADPDDLSPSMAGFTLMDYETQGSPAVTFGLVKGELRITGINY